MHASGDSLARRLTVFKDGFFHRLSSDERRIVLASTEAIEREVRHNRHFQVGEAAPDFTIADQHGRPVSLSEQLTYGPVILLFVRGSWCPFSALALRSYQDALAAVHDAGASLLAITPEPPHRCSTMAERDLLAFPTLSDSDGTVSDAYGVTYEVPPSLRALYAKWGQDLPSLNQTSTWRIPLPATFLVATDGRIVKAHVPTSIYARLEPATVIHLLETMQVVA